MSEFKEKNDLLQELLRLEGLDFPKDATDEERERIDVERQSFVLRVGLNRLSVEELRTVLEDQRTVER